MVSEAIKKVMAIGFPRIKVAKEIPPHLWRHDLILLESPKKPLGCYTIPTNTIWVRYDCRVFIFHELLHWWGWAQGGAAHWIHNWIDSPKMHMAQPWLERKFPW